MEVYTRPGPVFLIEILVDRTRHVQINEAFQYVLPLRLNNPESSLVRTVTYIYDQ